MNHSLPTQAPNPWSFLPFALTIFTSAFLLFQVQPLVSKQILPWFGGSPAVWTTAMLFFQTLLCLGYLYAHALAALPSRKTQARIHVVLLVVAALAVMLGTLYPLVLDALGMGKISVGPPYFDAVFMPLMAPAVFLMGIGPLARWKNAELPALAMRLRWAAAVAIAGALITGALAGEVRLVTTLGLVMAYWIVGSVATDLWGRVHPQGMDWANAPARLRQIPRALAGMMVAHLGIAVFCIGVAMVKTYEVESDVKMLIGDSTTVRGYTFTLDGIKELQGPNYVAAQGQMRVSRDGHPIADLRPEKRIYRVQQNPMTEAAIDTGLTRDLYVSLGEQVQGGAWIVRVYVKPFIDWIWFGCLFMALGGLLAVTDRRYRRPMETQ